MSSPIFLKFLFYPDKTLRFRVKRAWFLRPLLKYGILGSDTYLMDPKKYQELLDSVAETDYDPELAAPVVKKLLHEPHVCSRPNCGQIVSEDLVIATYYDFPRPHWRPNCKTCLCYLNPSTGEPQKGPKSETVNKINAIVRAHYKQRDLEAGTVPIKKPRRKRADESTTVYQNHVEIKTELDDATITQYIYTGDK